MIWHIATDMSAQAMLDEEKHAMHAYIFRLIYIKMCKSYAFILEGNVAAEIVVNCNHGIAPLFQQFPTGMGHYTGEPERNVQAVALGHTVFS